METSKSSDQTSIAAPLEDDLLLDSRRRRRHLHLAAPSSSVCIVLIAALFSAACLSIALRNAAQVTELKERLERLEERVSESDDDDDVESETIYQSETGDLIGRKTEGGYIIRHRQRRDAKRQQKKKKEKIPSSSAIHLTLNISETAERTQILRSGGVVTLGYGNLTVRGFRPQKEHHNGDHSFPYKAWKVADNWSLQGKDYTFNRSDGKVKVERKGLYYIYSQILYHNSAARSSYVIMVDNEMYVKCMESVDAVMSDSHSSDNARYKTCYVGAARVLNKGQHVWISDLYGHYVYPDVHANFFGLIKIADLDK